MSADPDAERLSGETVKDLYSVCVATYKRPEGLTALLESIDGQVVPPHATVEIIVVDNDEPSAQELVENFALQSRFPIRYFGQPEPNISITRNVAVREAKGEFLWFVDDDEIAIATCLEQLAKVLHEHDADAVFGPVLPVFESEHPDWLTHSPTFNRPRSATGGRSDAYRTSNTLVRTSSIRSFDGPFDPAFGVTGGSDSMLFRQMERDGASLIDADEAVAYEHVPDSRANWVWMKGRARRQGQNFARQVVLLNEGVMNREVLEISVKAAARLLQSGIGAATSGSDRGKRTAHQLRLWSNIGKFEGLWGETTNRAE